MKIHPLYKYRTWLGCITLLLSLFAATAQAAEYSSAKSLGKPDGKIMGCPSGSFWDPKNGGQCWTCKTGKRSVFPVDGPKACTVEGFTTFAAAKRLEANKSRCPSGSFFDIGKGSCWTCPSGTKRTVFAVDGGKACERITPKQKRKAKYVYKVESLLKKCKKGTFANAGSRSCYTCPKGWKHDPSKRVKTNGVCYKPRKVTHKPASETRDVSLSCKRGFFDPIDNGSCWTCPADHVRQVSSVKDPKACMKVQKPKFTRATFVSQHKPKASQVLKGASQLGCANKGSNAFFDPKNGGSCWSCPTSNPVRSLYPVDSGQACASKTCGKEGGRPCLVWERIPSCDAGLVEDFMNNECRRPKNFACHAYVNSVAGLSRAVDEANAAGEQLSKEAIERIPGAKLLLRTMARKMQEVQEQASKVANRLPLDRAMQPMDQFLAAHQDQIRIVDNLVEQGKRVQKDLRNVLLDPEVVCAGNLGRLNYQLERLGFKSLATPSRRISIPMAARHSAPRAMMVSAKPRQQAARQASRNTGILRHHRVTFDYSLSLPTEKLLPLVGITPPESFNMPLSLGIQLATNFSDSTHLYFSHGFGVGASAPDSSESGNFLAKFFGATDLSVGYQYNGPAAQPCTDDDAYGWGFAFGLTDWLSIGINPQSRPMWSGFAVTLPKPAYGWPDQAAKALTKPSFSASYPELASVGFRYDATLEIKPRAKSCGPIH